MSNSSNNQSLEKHSDKTFKTWYFGIIGYFYFGQGYALSSLVLLLPLYLLEELNAPSYTFAVAISALIIFPWYTKFIFGILSDNFPIKNYGRRKPYLVVATFFSLIGWLTLGIHTEANFLFILSGVSLAIGSALADAVIDGQVVEITPSQYIGRVQGVAWGFRGFGIGSAGIISAQIVEIFGWQMMFYFASIFGISISIIVLVLPQMHQEISTDGLSKFAYILQSLKSIFSKPRNWKRISFFFLTGTALSVVPLLTLIMEREFEYSIGVIGYGALFFAIGNLFGSILNGMIFDISDNLRRFVLLSLSYGFIIFLGIGLIIIEGRVFQFSYLFLIGLTAGAYEAYQLKVIQEETIERFEGTIFAIWTGISNLGQFAFGSLVIIRLAEFFNLSILILMQIILVVLLLVIYAIQFIRFKD